MGAARRHPIRLVLVVLLVWLAASAILVVLSARDLRQGVATVQAFRSDAAPGRLADGTAETSMRDAQGSFSSAARRLDNPLLAPATVLPVAGRQLRSVRALAHAADDTASAGVTALGDIRQLVDRPSAAGPSRLLLVQDATSVVERLRNELRSVELGPDEGLVAPVASRRAELREALDEVDVTLDTASRSLASLGSLLDGGRYLLLAANNAEMRAGSGMFLSAGVVNATDGHLALGEMLHTAELLLPTGVPLEGDVGARWGWTALGKEWREPGVTPRFDETGRLAAAMWQRRTGERVAGVLALDVPALAALLNATGPVTVDGVEISGATVEQFLLKDQYEDLGYGNSEFERSQAARRDRLGELAGATVKRLEAGEFDPVALASNLASAIRGRHLMVWSADADEQAGWQKAGVAGELTPRSMQLGVLNRAGNKLDPYLDLTAEVEVAPNGTGSSVTVAVRIVSSAPAGPPYVAGPFGDLKIEPGTYRGLVTLSLPGDATGIAVEGGRLVVAGPDGPTNVAAVDLDLRRGETRELTFRFDVAAPMTARVEASSRRPAVTWVHDGVSRSDESAFDLVLAG